MDARSLVETDEGRKRILYRDTQGRLSIGVGYDIEDNGLPDDIIDRLFDLTFTRAETAVADLFGFTPDPASARHAALIDMAFELGRDGLAAFHDLRTAYAREDWGGCAAAALDSLYARQVPNRAHRIAELLRTDDWKAIA